MDSLPLHRLGSPYCRLIDHIGTGFFLGLPLYSVDLCDCFCASNIFFLIIVALEYSLKSESMIPPTLFFFLKIVLDIWGLLWFPTNFRILDSSSVKNAIDILIRIALSL